MSNKLNTVLSIFCKKKVLTFSELETLLGCSIATVRRHLKNWGTYSSYNRNGGYYVLPEVPEFNEHQIWKYRNIYFSRHGTLKKTLVSLINNSNAGLNVFEANQILSISVHGILSQQFIHSDNFNREKHKGVYIYYSKDHDIYLKQKHERSKLINTKSIQELPTDSEAVIILVEFIKHPQDNLEQLYHRVRYKKLNTSTIKISNLLEYHNLLKKTLE